MRFRSALLAIAVAACVFLVPQRVEATAILFTDRAAFDASLDGDYQLFTEFPVNDLSLIGAGILAGNYGGLRFADDFAYISFGDVLSFHPPFPSSGPCCASVTGTVTAVGFDVISSSYRYFPGDVGSPPQIVDVPLLFGFSTTGGLGATVSVLPGTFFGLQLIDDALADFSLGNINPAPRIGSSLSVIDNLAVQSVPEPATALLLSLSVGAMVLFQRRRFTRPK